MAKFDIKKEYPKLYRATTKKISSLTIPMIKYIAIDGIGNPTVPEEIVFSGSKLEGIWDTYDNSHFDVTRKKMIKYTLMMPQPPILTDHILEEVKNEVLTKTGNCLALDVYLKEFEEGKCIQMLHIGPYNTEINSTKQIMEYITVANLKLYI